MYLVWDFDGTRATRQGHWPGTLCEAVFARYPAARSGWMIGDSWRADVQGAQAVGMRTILVREPHPEAPVQCDTLHDVVGIVGTP